MPEKINSAKPNNMKLRNGKTYEISKKKYVSSSDDSSSSWIDEEEEEEDDITEEHTEEKFDVKEFRTLLADLFPSKYSVEKAKNTQLKTKKNEETNNSSSDKKVTKNNVKKSTDKQKIESIKKNKKVEKIEMSSEDIGDDDTYSEDDEDYEEDCDDDDEDDNYRHKGKGMGIKPGKINIIFTMAGNRMNQEDDDEDYDEEDDEDYEDDDEEYEEDDDEEYEEESCEECECDDDNSEKTDSTDEADTQDKNKKSSTKLKDDEIIAKFKEMTQKLLSSGNKNSTILKNISNITEKYEAEAKKKQKQQINNKKKKNVKDFKKLLRTNYITNDITFFKQKLNCDEQQLILKEMESIQKMTKVEKPYRLTLLESNIPTEFKSCALRRLNQLRYMEPGSGEYYKIKNWIDAFMQIPFGTYRNLPVTLTDGVDKCHEFMDNAKTCLDKEVFGLNDAKMQIMQMIGQWIANPEAVGTAIAIQGPMGTGKTTLVKDGISKILNREFAFIALGGATDSSFLEGHSYTYEGSTWGKIVDILIKCKSMNPVIYFDELDKVSLTPRGEEIIGILTHLTDTSQNTKFHDKYFSEIDFDLSKCLFIFSYNDESKVNPILRDRMYRIHTSGYDKKEKTSIAKDYLLPKIMEQVKFESGQIDIPDETIQYIIDNHTQSENGVRNLKRCLEIIYTKLNLYRLMKPGTNLFEQEMSINIEFPLTVTIDIVNKLLKKNKEESVPYGMYT